MADNDFTSIVHVYHVTETVFKNGLGKESKFFYISPEDNEVVRESESRFSVPDSYAFEGRTKHKVPITLAEKLVEMDEPPQIQKLPNGMPAISAEWLNESTRLEYQRRGISPKERDDLIEKIRQLTIPEYKHPLDGEYIIYNYLSEDHFGTGYALTLLKVEDNELKTIFNPLDYIDEMTCNLSSIGEDQTNELLDYMKEKGIKKAYTVFHHSKPFFWIKPGFISTTLSPDSDHDGYQYDPICIDTEEFVLLKDHGIELLLYDEDRKEIM